VFAAIAGCGYAVLRPQLPRDGLLLGQPAPRGQGQAASERPELPGGRAPSWRSSRPGAGATP